MSIKKSFFILIILISTLVFGQGKKTEIGIITENDLYTSSKNDMYYTNGLEVFYRHLANNGDDKINKKINEFRVGQYIYNPRTINADDIKTNDRPFAGYIFIEAGQSFFYQDESVIKVKAQIGYVGPNSYAKEIQGYFHTILGHKKVSGWQNQISNALALQSQFLYSKNIFANKNQQFIDFNIQSVANLGTVLTGFSTGFVTRLGFKKLARIYNSTLYGAAVNNNSQEVKESEFYFYLAPSINYQLYDATIQGSLFNDHSPITYDIIPFRFNGEAGLTYLKNNMNLSYVFVYRGKEVRNEINTGYFYGSIAISFLFK